MITAQNRNMSLDSKIILNNVDYLNQITIQKMIQRLLKDASISRLKLAKYLDITTLDLLKLAEDRAPLNLVKRISLPLVNRYCLTEFIN